MHTLLRGVYYMQKRIKNIVEDLDIDYKRNLVDENKSKIFDKEREMAKLTFDRKIGKYAFNLDAYFYYMNLINKSKYSRFRNEIKNRLNELYFDIIKAENDKDVLEYKKLRDEVKLLKDEYRDYYKTINIDFRECLCSLDYPDIFVFQGDITDDVKFYRSIIDSNQFYGCYGDISDLVVYPNSELVSHREFKHFYNKISFKYLEDVSKNLDYDLDKKYNLVRKA